jgi:hypothetical protein
MPSRSEIARPEGNYSYSAENDVRREAEYNVTRLGSRWLNTERITAFSQLHNEPEWSLAKDGILRELVDAGAPIDVICSRLKCSCDAVRTRVLVLRLSVRSPA